MLLSFESLSSSVIIKSGVLMFRSSSFCVLLHLEERFACFTDIWCTTRARDLPVRRAANNMSQFYDSWSRSKHLSCYDIPMTWNRMSQRFPARCIILLPSLNPLENSSSFACLHFPIFFPENEVSSSWGRRTHHLSCCLMDTESSTQVIAFGSKTRRLASCVSFLAYDRITMCLDMHMNLSLPLSLFLSSTKESSWTDFHLFIIRHLRCRSFFFRHKSHAFHLSIEETLWSFYLFTTCM
jgi:hypothetical protein